MKPDRWIAIVAASIIASVCVRVRAHEREHLSRRAMSNDGDVGEHRFDGHARDAREGAEQRDSPEAVVAATDHVRRREARARRRARIAFELARAQTSLCQCAYAAPVSEIAVAIHPPISIVCGGAGTTTRLPATIRIRT